MSITGGDEQHRRGELHRHQRRRGRRPPQRYTGVSISAARTTPSAARRPDEATSSPTTATTACRVDDADATGNTIRGNSIHSNGDKGIENERRRQHRAGAARHHRLRLGDGHRLRQLHHRRLLRRRGRGQGVRGLDHRQRRRQLDLLAAPSRAPTSPPPPPTPTATPPSSRRRWPSPSRRPRRRLPRPPTPTATADAGRNAYPLPGPPAPSSGAPAGTTPPGAAPPPPRRSSPARRASTPPPIASRTRGLERYFPDRPDISNMGPLAQYDAFLILITQPVTCVMPVTAASGSSRTLQWGVGWHNEGWSGADGTPPQDAFACADGSYAAAYRFADAGLGALLPGPAGHLQHGAAEQVRRLPHPGDRARELHHAHRARRTRSLPLPSALC